MPGIYKYSPLTNYPILTGEACADDGISVKIYLCVGTYDPPKPCNQQDPLKDLTTQFYDPQTKQRLVYWTETNKIATHCGGAEKEAYLYQYFRPGVVTNDPMKKGDLVYIEN